MVYRAFKHFRYLTRDWPPKASLEDFESLHFVQQLGLVAQQIPLLQLDVTKLLGSLDFLQQAEQFVLEVSIEVYFITQRP